MMDDNPYGGPVVTAEEVMAFDSAEVVEGYNDGSANEPEPSGNRSKAYWHGWRNGMVDGRHMKGDAAMNQLIRDMRAKKAGLFDPKVWP